MPIRGATAGIIPGTTDTRGFTTVVAASNSLDPTLAPVAYRCSGVADDVEINAAIVAVAATGGGMVRLLEGTYNLAASVLPLSSVNISGNGWVSILDGTTVCHPLDINAQIFIQLKNFAVQTTSGGGSAFNGVNIRGGSSDILITQFAVLASDQDGIAMTSADSDIWVDTTAIGNIDRYGVNCDGDDCVFREIELHTAMGDDAIWLGPNSDGCDVSQNHIHVWTGEPVDDDGDNNVRLNKCTVAGVPVVAWNSKGCGFATIQACIDHQAGSGSVTIEPGTHSVAGGVISLDAADTSLRICGAGMVVTTLTSAAGTCLDINAAVNIQIEDLSVQTTGVGANDALVVRGASGVIHLIKIACADAGQDAVSIAAASSNVFMEALDLSGPGGGAIARYGVNVAGDNCKLSLSRINNTGSDGVWVQAGAQNNIVSLNRISGWVGEAIDNDEVSSIVAHNSTQV